MKNLWYCPQCKDLEIKDCLPRQLIHKDESLVNHCTFINLRNGFGMPIHHYLCSCGNERAGAMTIPDKPDVDVDDIVYYYKSVISIYQEIE